MAVLVTQSLAATGASDPVQGGQKTDISLSGTWVGTAVVQRYLGTGWKDMGSYTANTELVCENARGNQVRVSFTRTSGTLEVTLATLI